MTFLTPLQLARSISALGRPAISLRAQARRAGLLYAAGGLAAPFALGYVPATLFVSGNPAATTERIRTSHALLRMGMAGELYHCILIFLSALALYRLFRGVSSGLSTLMVALILTSVPIELANLANFGATLLLTSNAAWLHAFTAEQINALTYMFFRLHGGGLLVAQVFWGAWLFPYGIVAIRSGFIPRWIGVALLTAGVGALLGSLAGLFFPGYGPALRPVSMFLMAGEVPMLVWLIGWGVREGNNTLLTAE